MMPKKLYNFMIDPELADGLKALKRKHGTPEGETVRRALAGYLKKHGVMRTARKRASTRPVKA